METEWAQGKGRGGEPTLTLPAIYPLSPGYFNYILSPPYLAIIFSVLQIKKLVFRKIKQLTLSEGVGARGEMDSSAAPS